MIPLRNRDILIEKLREGHSILEACELSHISKASLYRLMKTELDLKEDFEKAIFDSKEKARKEKKKKQEKGMSDLKNLILKKGK